MTTVFGIYTNHQFSLRYQENKLRLQRSLALGILPRGNVRGKRHACKVVVDSTPLPKLRRCGLQNTTRMYEFIYFTLKIITVLVVDNYKLTFGVFFLMISSLFSHRQKGFKKKNNLLFIRGRIILHIADLNIIFNKIKHS